MASGNLCSCIKTPLSLNIYQEGCYLDEAIYCAGVFPVFDVKFVHVYCLRCLLLCVIILGSYLARLATWGKQQHSGYQATINVTLSHGQHNKTINIQLLLY